MTTSSSCCASSKCSQLCPSLIDHLYPVIITITNTFIIHLYHFLSVTNCAILLSTSIAWCLSIWALTRGSPLALAMRMAALLRQLPVRSLAMKTNWPIDSRSTPRTCYLMAIFSFISIPKRLQVLQNRFSCSRFDCTNLPNDLNSASGICDGVYGVWYPKSTLSILTICTMFFYSLFTNGSFFAAYLLKTPIHLVRFLLESYFTLPRTSNPL